MESKNLNNHQFINKIQTIRGLKSSLDFIDSYKYEFTDADIINIFKIKCGQKNIYYISLILGYKEPKHIDLLCRVLLDKTDRISKERVFAILMSEGIKKSVKLLLNIKINFTKRILNYLLSKYQSHYLTYIDICKFYKPWGSVMTQYEIIDKLSIALFSFRANQNKKFYLINNESEKIKEIFI